MNLTGWTFKQDGARVRVYNARGQYAAHISAHPRFGWSYDYHDTSLWGYRACELLEAIGGPTYQQGIALASESAA